MNPNAPLIMVYDTETTGLWDFKANWNAPHQPHLVQLGYKIYDFEGNTIFEIGHLVNSTIMPNWGGIDPGAYEAHHIKEELLPQWGWSPEDSMSLFQRWANRCCLHIAHNDDYDFKVMQLFALRCGWDPNIFPGDRFCTMKFTTNICKVPNPKGFGNKWPKLIEAYRHFFGKDFEDAHNALADVNACAAIYWHLVKLELVRLPNVSH
jgi:DNA polymerase-3 subunit epsilon